MKIEKVNSNQIKCFLNKGDLLSRQIKVSELAYGTEKAQELFKDMMDQASNEFGFEVENVPLMIEAVPLSTDSIMLIITKVDNPEELEDKFTGLPMADTRKFKKKEAAEKEEAHTSVESDDAQISLPTFLVYQFDTLDATTAIATRLFPFSIENSSLYKDPSNHTYYLSLISSSIDRNSFKILRGILSEYAVQVPCKRSALSYYDEHFDTIIKDKALEVLLIL
ncbi:MAG: competence protein [Firmicutes bacterium HGW-Firmicutes-1]|jgi:adapter protein MecA 1/2|nr:MAG: competence protein [Firmicutes bacterium HGW-Firmicutes-1]